MITCRNDGAQDAHDRLQLNDLYIMNLIVSITKSPPGVSLSQTQQVFDEQGGNIGRSDRNTWVLADPDRYISSTHCKIEFDNGSFYLVDESTNGTYLNHAEQPMGKGERAALEDGMQFSVGDYEFSITISNQAASAPPGAVGPFGQEISLPPASPPPIADNFGQDLPMSSDQDLYQPVQITPHNESVVPGQENILDPLRLFDQVQRKSSPDVIPNEPNNSFYNNPVGHVPVSDEAFTPPKVKHDELIGEDWDRTEYGYSQNQKPPATGSGNSPGRKVKRKTGQPTHLELMPDVNSGQHIPNRVSAKHKAKPPQRKPPANMQRASQPQATGYDTGAPGAPDPADVSRLAGAVDNDMLAAMGLDKSQFSPEQLAQLNYIIGQFVRHTVEGLLKVLRARSTIKNELRMGVTTVQPRDNNPIKFSADVDDALEHLFVRQSKAYLPPIASVNESFETILDHQVAVLAGMRAAFKALIQKFDPVQLTARFETQSGSGIFPGSKKVKHWEAYNDFYNMQVRDLDSSFQQLFGEEFVKAYESQLVQLSIARRQDKNNN